MQFITNSASLSVCFSDSQGSARSRAASVMRSILQSAGWGGMGAAAIGVTLPQVLQVLQSLPNLQQIQLWGHAGGLGGKTLTSVAAFVQAVEAKRRLEERNSSSSSSSSWAGGLLGQASGQLLTAGSAGLVIGELLCSFGSLLTPTDLAEVESWPRVDSRAQVESSHGVESRVGVESVGIKAEGGLSQGNTQPQQELEQPAGTSSSKADGAAAAAAAAALCDGCTDVCASAETSSVSFSVVSRASSSESSDAESSDYRSGSGCSRSSSDSSNSFSSSSSSSGRVADGGCSSGGGSNGRVADGGCTSSSSSVRHNLRYRGVEAYSQQQANPLQLAVGGMGSCAAVDAVRHTGRDQSSKQQPSMLQPQSRPQPQPQPQATSTLLTQAQALAQAQAQHNTPFCMQQQVCSSLAGSTAATAASNAATAASTTATAASTAAAAASTAAAAAGTAATAEDFVKQAVRLKSVQPDEVFVVQLLQQLPGLQLLHLHKCRHLQEEGQRLARHCCGRYSAATVTFR